MQPALPLEASLTCAFRAVESLRDVFVRGGDLAHQSPGPTLALSHDLLFVTSLGINEQGGIDDSIPPTEALALLIDADNHANDLAEAFDARLDHGNLSGAFAVCEKMMAEDDDTADDARARLDVALVESCEELKRMLHSLAERLEQAFIFGEVPEEDRAEITAKIDDALHRP